MDNINIVVEPIVNEVSITVQEIVTEVSILIAPDGEINTINSKVLNEIAGSDKVVNIVSLTQAEYDAGVPNPATFYIIKN